MAAGDTLRRITQNDQLILNSAGAVVGVKNPNASGSDLRYDPSAVATGFINGIAVPLLSASGIPRRSSIRQVMATPPTQTNGGTPTLGTYWPATTQIGTVAAAGEFFTFTRGSMGIPGGVFLTGNNVTQTATPTYGQNMIGASFFHDGQNLEIFVGGGAGASFNIKVDDQYVSLTAVASPGDSAFHYYKYAFGSRSKRRIDIFGHQMAFGGVYTDASDSISPAPIRGPRAIVMGDSFTFGTGATASSTGGFVQALSDTLGWDDIWPSGLGGTGYLNNNVGAAVTFRQRVQHDVIAYNPKIVWIVGGINDIAVGTAAQIGTEAAALFAQIKTGLPNCLLLASMNFNKGVNGVSASNLAAKAAISNACIAAGGYFLDLMEEPFQNGYVPIVTSLSSQASSGLAGTTGISTVNSLPVRSTVQIDNERIQIKTCTGSGPYTCTFDGTLQSTHAAGAAVTQVGDSFWTGTGRVGTTTGYGNCDVYVIADGTHPSDAGHVAMGQELASLLMSALAAA